MNTRPTIVARFTYNLACYIVVVFPDNWYSTDEEDNAPVVMPDAPYWWRKDALDAT